MGREIELTNGGFALIDEEDYALVKDKKWCKAANGYIICVQYLRRVNGKTKNAAFLLHRVVMNATGRQMIDHINRDKSDNRKENLRFVDHSINGWNSKTRKDSLSGIKGVSFHTGMGKWRCRYKKNGVDIHIGTFDTKEEAITAYKEATKDMPLRYDTGG